MPPTLTQAENPTYGIAEDFISPQGEGTHAGRLMYFLRLAGCNVGVPYKTQESVQDLPRSLQLPVLQNPAHTVCTSSFGQQFLCDTDYKAADKVRALGLSAYLKRLAGAAEVRDICITGGEPLLWDLVPLMHQARGLGLRVHIETSGTKPISPEVASLAYHICCSPKKGYLPENGPRIHAFKFLVDPHSEGYDRLLFIRHADELSQTNPKAEVYIQPVNGIDQVDLTSLIEVTRHILPARPEWRLSLQLHKILGVR